MVGTSTYYRVWYNMSINVFRFTVITLNTNRILIFKRFIIDKRVYFARRNIEIVTVAQAAVQCSHYKTTPIRAHNLPYGYRLFHSAKYIIYWWP